MTPRKHRKCAWCKKEFRQFKTTDKWCSRPCYLLDFTQKEIEKKRDNIKESLKKLSWYEGIAKAIFQKWVRLRDKDLPCISCGTLNSPIWDGGHYLKAELFSGLIFHPWNCHKQCRKCNYYGGGNETNYRDGLIKRYGENYVSSLESLMNQHREKTYTREVLTEIIQHYKLKIKNNDFDSRPGKPECSFVAERSAA